MDGSTKELEFGFRFFGERKDIDVGLKTIEQFVRYHGFSFKIVDGRDTETYGKKCHQCGNPYHWNRDCEESEQFTDIKVGVPLDQARKLFKIMSSFSSFPQMTDRNVC